MQVHDISGAGDVPNPVGALACSIGVNGKGEHVSDRGHEHLNADKEVLEAVDCVGQCGEVGPLRGQNNVEFD